MAIDPIRAIAREHLLLESHSFLTLPATLPAAGIPIAGRVLGPDGEPIDHLVPGPSTLEAQVAGSGRLASLQVEIPDAPARSCATSNSAPASLSPAS